MRPIILELSNFMSYRHALFDLSEIEIASIVGPNGAGKSTILQAMTYALWGKVRTASHNDVVRRGEGTCAVTLMFSIKDRTFAVTRRRHLAGNGSSDLELSEKDGAKAIPLTAATIKETQAKIDALLGMSYEAFSNSVLLQQGEASRFSDARPGERKELLAEMLDLVWFQVLEAKARARMKEIVTEATSAQALLDDRTSTLEESATVAEVEVQIKETKEKLDEIATEVINKTEALQLNQSTLAETKTLQAELNGKLETKASYEQRVQEIKAEIDRVLQRETDLGRILDEAGEREAAKEKLDHRREEIGNLEEIIVEFNRLAALAEGLEDDQNSLIEAQAELDILLGRVADLRSQADRLEREEKDQTDQLNFLIEGAQEATAEVHRLMALKEGAEKRVAALSSPGANCPTCNQPIADRTKVLKDAKRSLQDNQDSLRTAEENEEIAISAAREMEWERDDIRKLADENARQLGSLAGDVRVLNTEIANYQKSIDVKEDAWEKMNDLDFDRRRYVELQDYINAHAPGIDERYRSLQSAREEIEREEKRHEEYSERYTKGTQMLLDLEKEIAMLEDMISGADVDGLETIISIQVVSLTSMRDNERELEREIARLEALSDKLFMIAAEITELQSKLGQLDVDRQVCGLLIKAASKTGAQALIIEAALPQLEKDANDLLSVMAGNMKIALQSQRQTQKGDAVETLDIVVYSGGQVAPIETLSGGERFRADLALRLAIGRMIGRRSSMAVEMLAIDEGFGSQDADGQEAVVQVVSSLIDLFGLILVISHVQSVAEAIGTVGNMIVVSKAGDESFVEVL